MKQEIKQATQQLLKSNKTRNTTSNKTSLKDEICNKQMLKNNHNNKFLTLRISTAKI